MCYSIILIFSLDTMHIRTYTSFRSVLPRAQNGVIMEFTRQSSNSIPFNTKSIASVYFFRKFWQLLTFQLKKMCIFKFSRFTYPKRTRIFLWLCAKVSKIYAQKTAATKKTHVPDLLCRLSLSCRCTSAVPKFPST